MAFKIDPLQPRWLKGRPQQNDVVHPDKGTKCGRAWEVCYDLCTLYGTAITLTMAVAETKRRKLNEGNMKSEFYMWRKFWGIRTPTRYRSA